MAQLTFLSFQSQLYSYTLASVVEMSPSCAQCGILSLAWDLDGLHSVGYSILYIADSLRHCHVQGHSDRTHFDGI